MSCDIFSSHEAYKLLKDKYILMFGDSNMRALYKDLTWLLEMGSVIPKGALQVKNEESHANDKRISNGTTHNGVNYEEIREYTGNPKITYHFITRLNSPNFYEAFDSIENNPDIILINSCLWDLSRWGPNCVQKYKQNVMKVMQFLRNYYSDARVIWTTTPPPSFQCNGGFLLKEVEFLRSMLPWHVLEANCYTANAAKVFNIDTIDFHYHMRFLLHHRAPDGIHWMPKSVRYMTNLLLTHLALCWNYSLPGVLELNSKFVVASSICTSQSMSNLNNVQGQEMSAINTRNNGGCMYRAKQNNCKIVKRSVLRASVRCYSNTRDPNIYWGRKYKFL